MPVVTRRMLLVVSIAVAALLYGVLIALAPRITLVRAGGAVEHMRRVFSVRLADELPAPYEDVQQPAAGLVSRPGSIEDLLQRETEMLTPAAPLPTQTADTPRMAERAAVDTLEREHDLAPEEDLLERLDASIIEISEERARDEVEIARRLVHPSVNRVIEEGEFPVMRGVVDPTDRDVLAFMRQPMSPPGGLRDQAESAPPAEPGILGIDAATEELPELSTEEIFTQSPAAEEASAESPYVFIDDLVDIELTTYLAADEPEGYFRVRIMPRPGAAMAVLPKDVTYVIDASTSILQRRLDLTARGLSDALARLRPEDRFNVVVFRDAVQYFRPGPVPATRDNVQAARDFLTQMQAQGGTDIYDAIRPVVQQAPREGLPGLVVLVSDGHPTAGVRDSRHLINSLTQQNTHRNTVLAYGGGRTINQPLLDLLAYRNKGEAYVSENMGAIAEELPLFLARSNDPLLVNLQADFGRIRDDSVYPKELPDFFQGRAATVYGRFDPGADNRFSMRLTGVAGPAQKELVFRADLREAATGEVDIARRWAFERIYHLVGEIVRQGETPELVRQIRELGRKHNITTTYDF